MARTLEQLVEIAQEHAHVEGERDLDATMATLEPMPVYEIHPPSARLEGEELVRGYYRYLFEEFLPRLTGYQVRTEWVGPAGLMQEYLMWVRTDDGGIITKGLASVLAFGDEGLTGERIYGDEQLLRMMFGPFYDQAVPITDEAPSA